MRLENIETELAKNHHILKDIGGSANKLQVSATKTA
jgi:hypothetical protein